MGTMEIVLFQDDGKSGHWNGWNVKDPAREHGLLWGLQKVERQMTTPSPEIKGKSTFGITFRIWQREWQQKGSDEIHVHKTEVPERSAEIGWRRGHQQTQGDESVYNFSDFPEESNISTS